MIDEYEVTCDRCGTVRRVRKFPHICEPSPRTKAEIIAENHEHNARVRLL